MRRCNWCGEEVKRILAGSVECSFCGMPMFVEGDGTVLGDAPSIFESESVRCGFRACVCGVSILESRYCAQTAMAEWPSNSSVEKWEQGWKFAKERGLFAKSVK